MQIYEKDNIIVSMDEETGILLSVMKLIPTSFEGNVEITINDEEALFIKDYLGIDLGDCRDFECDVENANEIIRECFSIESAEVSMELDGKYLSEIIRVADGLMDKIYNSHNS